MGRIRWRAIRRRRSGSTAPLQFAVTTPADQDGAFTYNRTQQLYRFNWATPADWAGTCRQLVITLDDGKQLRANLRFN